MIYDISDMCDVLPTMISANPNSYKMSYNPPPQNKTKPKKLKNQKLTSIRPASLVFTKLIKHGVFARVLLKVAEGVDVATCRLSVPSPVQVGQVTEDRLAIGLQW